MQSRLQDEDSATVATSLVEGWFESDVDRSLVKSFVRMSFLEDLTMEKAFSGSFRHLATMSVPS